MKFLPYTARLVVALTASLQLSSCVSNPTLQQVAVMRQNQGRPNKDLTATYHLADVDVVNYTDKVKLNLTKHFKADSALRQGSAATQVTLATLAGAAETAGWSVSTASGLGLAAGYVFSLGHVFSAKDKAQAYEQAFTAIQAAEASYYFHRLGMGFRTENGRTIVVPGDANGRNDVPSADNLTPDGETLYYRVSKVLKVLNDALANKIPDLQDLKDAKGESNGSAAPPAKSADAAAPGSRSLSPPSSGGPKSASPSPSKPSEKPPNVDVGSDPIAKRLRQYWRPGGKVDPAHAARIQSFLTKNAITVSIPSFIEGTDFGPAREKLIADLGQDVGNSDPIANRVRDYWRPAGKVNPAHAANIQSFLTKKGIKKSIPSFINDTEFGPEREELIVDLGL